MTAKAIGWKSGLVFVGFLMLCCSFPALAQPVITINGPNPQYWECSVPYENYHAQAIDSFGNDITRDIHVEGLYNLDTMVLGAEYEVVYTVTDSTGATARAVRKVIIRDYTPPVFALEKHTDNRDGEVPITLVAAVYEGDKKPIPPLWLIELKKIYGPFPELEGEEEEDEEPDPSEFELTLEDIQDWPDWARNFALVWYFYPLGRNQIYDIPDWGYTPVQWTCIGDPWQDPGVKVFDACDITIPLDDVYVIMVECYTRDSYSWEKRIWNGRYTDPPYDKNLLPPGGKPYLNGYRLYYYAPDRDGNLGVAARDVMARYGGSLILAEPTHFQVKCGDDSILKEIEGLEGLDRYFDTCENDITYLITHTGKVEWDIPGTYHIVYNALGSFKRRTIEVLDANPVMTLLDEEQQVVSGLKATTVLLNWCEFLRTDPKDPGKVIVDEALQYWWPFRPDEGFYVTDGCDDGYLISSLTVPHGAGRITETLLDMAANGLKSSSSIYNYQEQLDELEEMGIKAIIERIWYEARDPRENKAYSERAAVIAYVPPVLSFNVNADGAAIVKADEAIDKADGEWIPSQHYFELNKLQCGQKAALPDGKFDLIGCEINNLPAYVIDTGGLDLDEPKVGTYDVTYSSYPADPDKGISLKVEVTVVDTQEPQVILGDFGVKKDDLWRIPCFENETKDSYELIDGCSGSSDMKTDKFVWRIIDDRYSSGTPAIARDIKGNPVDYLKNNRFLNDPGDYVIVYIVTDPDGNTNLPLDEAGLPYVFHSNGGLNVFDSNGKVLKRFETSVRLLRVEAAVFPSVDLPQDAEGFYLVDCNTNIKELLDESRVEQCAVDYSSPEVWKFEDDGSIKLNRNGYPVHHEPSGLQGRFGEYVAVFVSERGIESQPPMDDQKHARILQNKKGYLDDPNAPYILRFRIEDTEAPVLTLVGDDIVTLLAGAPYKELGCTVEDNCDLSLENEITQLPLPKDIDTTRPGSYSIVYTVADKSGNVGMATRTVNVIDLSVEDVEIVMLGDREITLECGDHFSDPGVEARYSGRSMKVFSRSFDYFGVIGSEVGTITVNYYTTTEHGTELLIGQRTIFVQDTTAPDIRLKGSASQTLALGSPYFEKGADAFDICDGPLTVFVEGKVISSKEGVYTLTYSAVDDAGNETKVVREVTVEKDKALAEGETPVIDEDEGENGEVPLEGEGDDDDLGCAGCAGCNGEKGLSTRFLSDYLLLGVSILALALFRRRG